MTIKYEDLIEAPNLFIQQIAQILSIEVDSQEIYRKTFELQPLDTSTDDTYSKETLLHKQHFTHTKDDEWRQIIPYEFQEKINKEFSSWFKECGYPPN